MCNDDRMLVDLYFLTSCKLAEGGYHKVYDVLQLDGAPLDVVVRVASPAFPKDRQVESEVATVIRYSTFFRKVATCKMIAAFTNIPVPRIHAWNSDTSNPVGAEYTILDNVKGTLASHNWGGGSL
ncbi:hypothetical protein EV702DRAFT_1048359 [Suillus placidus]|uniref:Uncharacterized protein n=1 Tax=Suillus placidus TaxID=48579 RepID=A0A9P6ZNR8_9AGAM|nr:hypothetical protein EV702DRAFT_1048359 [Suillus placidus]